VLDGSTTIEQQAACSRAQNHRSGVFLLRQLWRAGHGASVENGPSRRSPNCWT